MKLSCTGERPSGVAATTRRAACGRVGAQAGNSYSTIQKTEQTISINPLKFLQRGLSKLILFELVGNK